MSENKTHYAFPQHTPVFTAVVVIGAILVFGWFINRAYHPAPALQPRGNVNPADFAEDQRWKLTPEGRAKALAALRAREQAIATSYGTVDAKAGVYRIPVEEAVRLTVRDHAPK